MRFENPLEKDIFMAINVLRAEPGVYSQVVNEVKQKYPICANAKYTDRLIKFLDMNEQLPVIMYDVAAQDAVIKNNEIQCSPQVMRPPFGGNIAALT